MILSKKIDPVHALSNEIANVREKNDLVKVFSSKLRELFYFTQTSFWLIDKQKATCSPFLSDQEALPPKHRRKPGLPLDIYPGIADPLIVKIINSEVPVSFSLDKMIDDPDTPELIKLSYDKGIRNMLAIRLQCQMETIGFIIINSRRTDGFPESFRSVMQRIAPLLSVVVRNIIDSDRPDTPLPAPTPAQRKFSTIIGSGSEMQKVHQKMSLVAPTNSTVLLLGETGTGKELIARAIHQASPRKERPMVKINCAALPASLIESELFGHEKGAFTGASERRIGKFELADNGTLFLDEVGEMPIELQVKLLRVIQEREFERVGGRATIKVNVRLIAATNRSLEEEVRAGRFRQDLFYRLNVFPIHLPALRLRIEDIEPLANFFLARYTKESGRKITAISPGVIRELKGYPWPGNVRELEHLMERSILMTEGNELNEIQLPPGRSGPGSKDMEAGLPPKTLHDMERSYIIEILRKYDGKISGIGGASQFLEIPATTLHSKMKKLGISKVDYFGSLK